MVTTLGWHILPVVRRRLQSGQRSVHVQKQLLLKITKIKIESSGNGRSHSWQNGEHASYGPAFPGPEFSAYLPRAQIAACRRRRSMTRQRRRMIVTRRRWLVWRVTDNVWQSGRVADRYHTPVHATRGLWTRHDRWHAMYRHDSYSLHARLLHPSSSSLGSIRVLSSPSFHAKLLTVTLSQSQFHFLLRHFCVSELSEERLKVGIRLTLCAIHFSQ